MSSFTISFLRQLEAESIHIMREVAAEFKNPVMLYSVGKDSSVRIKILISRAKISSYQGF
jgi:sulfate adenylyltransferase subunit 2